MINKVTLIGNLGADPVVKTLDSGNKVATFSIATTENYKDKAGEWQSKTEWHNVVAWNLSASIAEKRLTKGSLVFVEGKLTHRSYDDKDGVKRYVTEVVANTIRPLEKRESQEQPAPQPQPVNEPIKPVGEADDDLPF